MTRQVDVKALISHIVKGDGEDRCRICMGDTSEGQVFLGDTVMMDGNRPISLSELLETITGITVLPDLERPMGICSECTQATLEAAHFREFCQESETKWGQYVGHLDQIPSVRELPGVSAILVDITNNEMIVTDVSKGGKHLVKEAIEFKEDADIEERDIPTIEDVKGNFECKCCGRKFAYAQHYSDHFSKSLDTRVCQICGEMMTIQSYLEHITIDHKQQPIVCKKCPSVFLKQKAYLLHKAKYHKPGSHSCGDCGRTFQSVYAMNAHNGVHAGKTCPGCNQFFKNQPCYLHHVKACCNLSNAKEKDIHRTKHKIMFEIKTKTNKKVKVGLRGSSNTECYCDYCGKKYSGKKYVAAHIQIVHMRTTHRPCPHCGKSFAAAHMSQHIKSHQESSLFTCQHCGLTLHSKLGFSQHLRIHTGETPYPCSYCDESFSGSSKRAVHVRKCHTNVQRPLKHQCKSCSAAFSLPYQLKKHIESAHGEAVAIDISCKVCDMKFGSMRGLVHHSKKHQK